MPRTRSDNQDDANTLDANQAVAFNFRLARESKGWTQDETAMHLEKHLGQRLKKTSISAIERSVESDRRRVFTVQEVVAFALTFDVPFLWFLIPPPDIGLKLEGLDGPIAQLWRIAIGTDAQADQILGRLAAFAEANPEAANEVAETALGFEPGVTMEHYQRVRLDGLIDMVTEELDPLDELFGEMSRLVDRYNETSTRYTLNSDAPRRAYRRTSEVLLGRKIWELINQEYGRKFPGLSLLDLVDRDDVPWETLIDTDRPEVRDAVLKFAEAIEPELRGYIRSEDGRVSE
jgi:transcriptional regulator with XRE-family HTH domain